jgi:DNA polymerase III subunit delta'
LVEDVLRLANGAATIRNEDLRGDLSALSQRVSFDWLRAAVSKTDELMELVRRNIQKSIALDAFAVDLRSRFGELRSR